MLTAVPRTVRTAASKLAAFKSGNFSFAMSSTTSSFQTVPTLFLFGARTFNVPQAATIDPAI
jgi:hypothetical protein